MIRKRANKCALYMENDGYIKCPLSYFTNTKVRVLGTEMLLNRSWYSAGLGRTWLKSCVIISSAYTVRKREGKKCLPLFYFWSHQVRRYTNLYNFAECVLVYVDADVYRYVCTCMLVWDRMCLSISESSTGSMQVDVWKLDNIDGDRKETLNRRTR